MTHSPHRVEHMLGYCFAGVACGLHAEVSIPATFAGSMLLQRGTPVPVYGHATATEKVVVACAGQRHLDGSCAYWSCGRISNAAMQGFNNIIRHLIAQADGFHDYECMKLKVCELPPMVSIKQ